MSKVRATTKQIVSAAPAAGVAGVLLAPENFGRLEVIIVNDSTAILYILYGDGIPTSTNYSVILPGNAAGVATLVEDKYQGVIKGVWASANGYAYVTEVTE
jgi:hypothetical protein